MRRGRGAMASSTFVIAILFLQGCAIKWWGSESGQDGPAQVELIKEPAIKDIPPDDGLLTGWRTSSATQSELVSRNATGLTYATLSDVLFNIDQDTVRMDAMRALEADAKLLPQDRVAYLLLEGRGDESGTSAYNLVLGERRARNVRSYLLELGLSIDVMTTSYGKDRPLCYEHTDDCRQRNRSVHFIIK